MDRRRYERSSGGRGRGPAPVGSAATPNRALGQEQEVLAGLRAAVRREDPRFADGLRLGRPVAPREYRERDTRLALAALAAVQAVMVVVGWDVLVVAGGVAMLPWIARRH